MEKKLRVILFFMAGALLLGACGRKERSRAAETPEEAVEAAMEGLKAMDLTTFNECTDNYVCTYRNWPGVPARREYRVFTELLQPGLKGKRYRANLRIAEKIMENLAWEIRAVREQDGQAQIDMEITNRDMAKVMGNYQIYILENMIQSEGTGITQLIKDMNGVIDGMITVMDSMDEEDTCTLPVTVTAYREDGRWKLHVSEEFINAFLGNIDSEEYPEETALRIEELEGQYERKMESWGDEFGEKVERWAEGFSD